MKMYTCNMGMQSNFLIGIDTHMFHMYAIVPGAQSTNIAIHNWFITKPVTRLLRILEIIIKKLEDPNSEGFPNMYMQCLLHIHCIKWCNFFLCFFTMCMSTKWYKSVILGKNNSNESITGYQVYNTNVNVNHALCTWGC